MTAAEIAEVLDLALSTVSAWLARIGLGKRSRLRATRAAQPLRAKAPRRADPHRRQEAGPHRRKGAGKRVIGTRQATGRGATAGSAATSASMTPPASPTWRSCPTSAVTPHRPSCDERWPGLPSAGMKVERVMTDNGSPYVSGVHADPAASSGSATCAPGPTGRAPTARQRASSRRCCARWAYGRLYGSSAERRGRSAGWLDRYNYQSKARLPRPPPTGGRLNELLGTTWLGNYS